MKNLILSICFFTTIICSEPKSLWCSDNNAVLANETAQKAPTEKAEALIAQIEMAKMYGADSNLAKGYGELALVYQRAETMCVGSKWYLAKEFIFDTDGFNNSNLSDVEYTSMSACGAHIDPVRRVKLSATPSTISFTWTEVETYGTFKKIFNLDRKTLKASSTGQGNFICELRDIDISDNLL
tara:strand:- start:46 stop:594 length:549 start_codon:yes stop_codon:yes gene_type:complete